MRPVLALVGSAAATLAIRQGFDRRPPPITGWTRPNYRDETVSLSGGAAVAIGSVALTALTGRPERRASYLLAGAASALAGAYDDLIAPRWERAGDKGARGHLQAVRQGRPSGGLVKVVTIGAGALACSLSRPSANSAWPSRLADAALVAGAANLVNLFDLRPGRAAKVVVLAGGAQLFGAGAVPAASAVGAAAAALPADLDERQMLGDTGANPLGALLGLALVEHGLRARLLGLTGILALTAASERISFSRVIGSVPVLRRLDEWGRRPAAVTAQHP